MTEMLSAAESAADRDLVLLGIGASAGGLEAFQSLLGALRPTDRFALILVQHLDPEHESLLPELLSKRTRLPVQSIEDGMEIESGNVYLIPPAFGLDIRGRVLKLVPFEAPRGLRRPIDSFFQALAREHGSNAAGVILSGTGSDGSNGVRAIKEAGGLVFAQDPKDARYDGMPRSAIGTGAVDLVLPAAEMIGVLRDFHDRASGIAPTIESDAEFIEKVVRNVRYRTGHDFSGYKSGTLLRRITLRMSVLGLTEPGDYLRELVQNRGEADRLFRDLLINVTSFFRDPAAFDALARVAIPGILEEKGRGDELRVWVPGCSTGQEAYTVAMILADAMTRLDVRARLCVFGTDIDEDALALARRAQYPNSIASEVPPQFLERYFTPTRHGFEVRGELRDMVRFSSQSLVKDPPFSRLDLITCRNLLIYFNHELQELAQRVFHYALRPGGFLMLGPSETAKAEGDPFVNVVPEHRIYRRNDALARSLDLPRGFRSISLASEATHDALPEQIFGLPYAAAEALVVRHVPPFLLIGPQDEVTRVGAGAERFVRLNPGTASLGIRALILPELEQPLKRLLTGSGLAGGSFRQTRVELSRDGEAQEVTIGCETLSNGLRLVTFGTIASPTSGSAADPDTRIVLDEAYVSQIEDELEEARLMVRTTVEELETSNEELKSSNEEMMSMNEELQSANEELSTTNEELQTKLAELAEVNADLANFMSSTQIATVFLDRELRLRSFTPEAATWFRFVEQDRGREITDIRARLDIGTIADVCRRVMAEGPAEEVAMVSTDGESEVIVRFAPYRSSSGDRGGVVFSIFDVTAVTRFARAAEEASADARASAEEIEELYLGSPGAMGLVDRDFRYLRANPKMADFSGLPNENLIGRSISEVHPDVAGRMVASVRRVFDSGEPVLRQVVRGTTPADPDVPRVWEIDWYPVHRSDGVRAVGFNVTDVTRLLELQADLRRIMRELQHRVKNMLSNVIALVNRARREQGDPQEILETLAQRIRALANTHNLLTSENWASTSLSDIFALELLNVYGEERVTLRGPEMRLNARATLSLGMVIHELATNASKYGAFSRPEGRVSVRWSRVDEGEGEEFRLVWQESGGPTVNPPSREGFGTQLMRSMVEGSFYGSIESNWEPAGLRLVVALPWNAATEVDYDSDLDPLRHADPLP
ncbi:PAS domain S-box protein [Cereibacter sphaeroides]|uniref:histidine kinase n=1 Tax=Cereibacter sphaeroides TaxID=1063 RepID=A0AAX1UN59_CERSP|nr:chemotaxis protein CheB [Cereibacter sphaeroides]RHZ96153.1 PAS domain S-box protein [Cereibacter sphaeroides]